MTVPVYLFTGPEFGERNSQVEAVKLSLKKQFGSSDDYSYYASDTRIEDVVSQLRTDSLFIPSTCIVLKNAEQIKKKEDIDLLSQWISSVTPSKENPKPSQSSVLILVSDEVSIDAKLDKLVPKENKKIFWEMFDDRKEEWLKSFFRKNGYMIENDAISLILDMIENNTEELRSQCNTFFLCFTKDHVITSKDVESILSHNREENAFTLFDVMTDYNESPVNRLQNSLGVLQKILLSKNSNSVMLLSGLAMCFRKLSLWQSLHNGSYPDELTLKKNGFTSKKSRTQYSRACRIWTSGQCSAISALIAKTDIDMRSLGTAATETQLTMLLYEIIIKNGAYCLEYDTDF